jgi:hypothetical protein
MTHLLLLRERDTARAISEENVAVIRELWDAYACGDVERVLEFCDPHVVMITLEEGPLYGVDAARRNHERWKEAWEVYTMRNWKSSGSMSSAKGGMPSKPPGCGSRRCRGRVWRSCALPSMRSTGPTGTRR